MRDVKRRRECAMPVMTDGREAGGKISGSERQIVDTSDK
jgi:hypothetical protein